MEILTAVSQNQNTKEAVFSSAQKILDNAGREKIAGIILCAAGKRKYSEINSSLKYYFKDIPVWGLNSELLFFNDKEFANVIILIAIIGSKPIFSNIILPRIGFGKQYEIKRDIAKKQENLFLTGDSDALNIRKVLLDFKDIEANIFGGLMSSLSSELTTVQFDQSDWKESGIGLCVFRDQVRIGTGVEQGWQSVGLDYLVSKTQGNSVLEISGQSPAELYADMFGIAKENWQKLPYSNLIRLYPLGVEMFPGSKDLHIKTPMKVDENGNFLFNTDINDGQIANLMIGNRENIMKAFLSAARKARRNFGSGKELFAIVFLDIAYSYFLKKELETVLSELKSELQEIPVLGVFTRGSIERANIGREPQIINQNIVVHIFGEK